jgi:hypothetical protein
VNQNREVAFTAKRIAKQHQVSHPTIEHDSQFTRAVGTIAANAGEDARKAILTGDERSRGRIRMFLRIADRLARTRQWPFERLAGLQDQLTYGYTQRDSRGRRIRLCEGQRVAVDTEIHVGSSYLFYMVLVQTLR